MTSRFCCILKGFLCSACTSSPNQEFQTLDKRGEKWRGSTSSLPSSCSEDLIRVCSCLGGAQGRSLAGSTPGLALCFLLPLCPSWHPLALQGAAPLCWAQPLSQCWALAAPAQMSLLEKLWRWAQGRAQLLVPSQDSVWQSLDIGSLNSSMWVLLFASAVSLLVCILERLFPNLLYKVLEYLTRSSSCVVNLQSLNWK